MSVEPNADADTIKKAFRREIARYHPDKVIHLGPEFQEMAATRAAELTVAYKTLGDPELREQYDASLAGHGQPPGVPDDSAPTAAEPYVQPVPAAEEEQAPPPAGRRMFESERAGRDQILRRAIAGRVRSAVESMFGAAEMPMVRGFDAAIVPLAKPRFLGSHPPRVLVRVSESVDAAAVAEAWTLAERSRVHAGKSPVLVMLFGRHLSPARELLKAMDAAARQRRSPDGPGEVVVVVVNASDWQCQLPEEVSGTVRKLIDKICS